MSRTRTATRLLHAWESGFSPGPGLLVTALAGGYRGALAARDWLYDRGVLRSRGVRCPVVSIGNLTVGGTGKTPAVELAVRTLADLGRRPAVVSRGYRRRSTGVQIVADSASIRLEPEDAGDEPFLLARRLPGVPVVVGSRRYDAARAAVERFGATAIVIDDGFQHRTLRKDLEIVMVRAGRPWGNGRLFPSGPLREPLEALARAHLVVATGLVEPPDLKAVADSLARHAPHVPILAARYAAVECWEASRMEAVPLAHLASRRLLGFAGIASPAAFRATLDGLGVTVADLLAFADHHWYTAADVSALDATASTLGAEGLVTTEKDWVRLRTVPRSGRPLYVVSVRLELLDGEEAWRRAFEDACRTR
jgi:tetraacyldisaccharide 4'-kinase